MGLSFMSIFKCSFDWVKWWEAQKPNEKKKNKRRKEENIEYFANANIIRIWPFQFCPKNAERIPTKFHFGYLVSLYSIFASIFRLAWFLVGLFETRIVILKLFQIEWICSNRIQSKDFRWIQFWNFRNRTYVQLKNHQRRRVNLRKISSKG